MRLLFFSALISLVASASISKVDEEQHEGSQVETPVESEMRELDGICGIRPIDFPSLPSGESRIIGGQDAVHGQYPWQGKLNVTLLEAGEKDYKGHWCGAVIISEFWLLSAAHCFDDFYGGFYHRSSFVVTVGNNKQSTVDSGEQTFAIDRLIIHKQYTIDTADFDIALIKIQQDINGRGISFNKFVQPACLPDSSTPETAGTECLISGWGRYNALRGDFPDVLQGARVPLVDQMKCKLAYISGFYSVTDRMICAGYNYNAIGGCNGDSGGPLVCKTGGFYTVHGLTSWGDGTCASFKPTVFARVSAFLPWIRHTVKSYSGTREEGHIPSRNKI